MTRETSGYREVSKERQLTRVSFTLLNIAPVPLTNARTASISKDDTTNLFESLDLTVTGNGSTDLLGARGDRELGLGLETVFGSLTGNSSGASHVFVGRVGARADECNLEFLWPVVLLDFLSELGDGGSKIGSERAVDVGLEFRQVLFGS